MSACNTPRLPAPKLRARIPELESATAAAKANLDLAQTTFKRMEELAAKKSISNQEMDEASARLKAAQANYEMTRARRTQTEFQNGAGGAGGSRRRNHARLLRSWPRHSPAW